MKTPTVAVLIPSYNHGHFITETLESVFRQTRRPDEVHVLDDGSTDDSVKKIEQAFADAGDIRCSLRVQKNRGISATRNALIANVSTDFVAFLDSDDLFAPNRLERMLEFAPGDGSFFAVSGVEFLFDSDSKERDDWHAGYGMMLLQAMAVPTFGFALLRSNFTISASNFILSRGLLDKIGYFDEGISICQDWDFVVRALAFVEPILVPETLLIYRRHPHNTSLQSDEKQHEVDMVYQKVGLWASKATLNQFAPTPLNCPNYFKIYALLCGSASGRSLATRFPAELLAFSSHKQKITRDSDAIRCLVSAARSPQSIVGLSNLELMNGCNVAWASAVA